MSSPDRLYVGAKEIAERLFGNCDQKSVRRIYHWNEQKPPKRPPFLRNVNGQPAAFESGIQNFTNGENNT